MPDRCSAVVLSWRRIHNLPEIVENLRAQPFVDDIVVAQNGDVPNRSPEAFDRLAEMHAARQFSWWWSHENWLTWTRFRAMDTCRHDAVLVQDDDVVPRCWPEVWERFRANPTRIVAALSRGHFNTDRRRHWGTAHEVLVGFGGCVDRRWRRVFQPYRDRHGRDGLFHSKADRLFSILLNRRHEVFPGDLKILIEAYASDCVSMQPNHRRDVREVRQRALQLLGIEASGEEVRQL